MDLRLALFTASLALASPFTVLAQGGQADTPNVPQDDVAGGAPRSDMWIWIVVALAIVAFVVFMAGRRPSPPRRV